jgi:glutaryl-CoA dehydrogenase
MSSVRQVPSPQAEPSPPLVDGDFYKIGDVLAKEERPTLALVRAFMEAEVAPIINDCWARATFPA